MQDVGAAPSPCRGAIVGADDKCPRGYFIGPEAPLKGEHKILRLRTSCYAQDDRLREAWKV